MTDRIEQHYFRCFKTPAGEKVLEHLQALTLKRALGPEASAETLRHLEGQRQLVAMVVAMINRAADND